MKKYFLIITGLFLIGCGDSYWVKNISGETQKINGEEVENGKCAKVKDGSLSTDFPFKAGSEDTEYGKDEPSHYTYDGESATKANNEAVKDCPDGTTAGDGTTAASDGTTTAGDGTTTAGDGTTTAGDGTTTAEGDGTTAEGDGTTAAGDGTTAAGDGTTAAEAKCTSELVLENITCGSNSATYYYLAAAAEGSKTAAEMAALVTVCSTHHGITHAFNFIASDGTSCKDNSKNSCGIVLDDWKASSESCNEPEKTVKPAE